MDPCRSCGCAIEPTGRVGRPRVYCPECRPSVRRGLRIPTVRKAKACEWCRREFTPNPNGVQRFCSGRCKQQSNDRRKYERRGKFCPTLTFRLSLYERDGWRCQLCLDPVDRDAHYLDNWAPSLDHIVPRSMGGSDHADNLRTTHRWCNVIRSDATNELRVSLFEVA